MGSAFVVEDASHSCTLPKATAEYTAVLFAVWQYSGHLGERKFLICADTLNCFCCLRPVSYTHLDVYKRQE